MGYPTLPVGNLWLKIISSHHHIFQILPKHPFVCPSPSLPSPILSCQVFFFSFYFLPHCPHQCAVCMHWKCFSSNEWSLLNARKCAWQFWRNAWMIFRKIFMGKFVFCNLKQTLTKVLYFTLYGEPSSELIAHVCLMFVSFDTTWKLLLWRWFKVAQFYDNIQLVNVM